MRMMPILLALASLSACDRDKQNEAPAAPVVPAAMTYEGAITTDAAAKVKHGERLSWVFDCKGCHGENLQGANVTDDDPKYGDMNAPNITLLMAEYSDAQLDRLIRHGEPKDGREFWFMPTETLQHMSDEDFAALAAYLRTFKPAGKQLPPIRKGEGFLADVKKGVFTDSRGMLKRFQAKQPVDLGPKHAFGRYIAMTTCTSCHNGELQGYEGFTPNLDIAVAYSHDELKVLLSTGKGKSKPDLGLMSLVGGESFSKFTPHEREAVAGYIKARAEQPQ